MVRDAEALRYHEGGRPGKVEIALTKPCVTPRELAIAYGPGLAAPCRAIGAEPERAFDCTAKGNLVAVVSNGSAVPGLGAVGPLAVKPVLEGIAVLFKRFADLDVFDLELASDDPEEIARAVRLLAPGFGGVALEKIRAPECFEIAERLTETLDVPVFGDDMHGTAIVSAAALVNAVELAGKRLDQVRVVVCGAGAAGLACAELYQLLGVAREHLLVCDSRGVVRVGREEGMNPWKARFAAETELRTLEAALEGADVLVGVSAGGVVTAEMLKRMAARPIVLALAHPEPEIDPRAARAARPDAILATGRPDHPNQVSNMLAFPFVFRGALDARASAINPQMRVAAVQALAALVREDVADEVRSAYAGAELEFGPECLLPKALDPRVLLRVAPAVASAALATGAARRDLDLDRYPLELERRLGYAREVVRRIYTLASRAPRTIVFPEGEEEKVLRACQTIVDEGIARPLLLGGPERVETLARELHVDLTGIRVEAPAASPRYARYCEELYRLRHRKGVTRELARGLMQRPDYFAAMAVHMKDADGLVTGLTRSYPEAVRPALQVIERAPGHEVAAGVFVLVVQHEVYFLADITVNIEPSADELVEIARGTAQVARTMGFEPRVALLSFSDFGSVQHPLTHKVAEAARKLRELEPELQADGEMQADTAVEPGKLAALFPFSRLQSRANVLVFPDLQSGNIACKLLQRLGGASTIGPILMGLARPVHVLERGASVDAIVRLAAVAAIEAHGGLGSAPR